MGDFSFEIENEEFDIECPECNHEFTFKGSDINHTIECPKCKTSIELQGNDFLNKITDIENQLNHLFD